MKKFLIAALTLTVALIAPARAQYSGDWLIALHVYVESVGAGVDTVYATGKHGTYFFETKGDCEIYLSKDEDVARVIKDTQTLIATARGGKDHWVGGGPGGTVYGRPKTSDGRPIDVIIEVPPNVHNIIAMGGATCQLKQSLPPETYCHPGDGHCPGETSPSNAHAHNTGGWLIAFHIWIPAVGGMSDVVYATQKHGAFFFETNGECEIFLSKDDRVESVIKETTGQLAREPDVPSSPGAHAHWRGQGNDGKVVVLMPGGFVSMQPPTPANIIAAGGVTCQRKQSLPPETYCHPGDGHCPGESSH